MHHIQQNVGTPSHPACGRWVLGSTRLLVGGIRDSVAVGMWSVGTRLQSACDWWQLGTCSQSVRNRLQYYMWGPHLNLSFTLNTTSWPPSTRENLRCWIGGSLRCRRTRSFSGKIRSGVGLGRGELPSEAFFPRPSPTPERILTETIGCAWSAS